MWYLKTSKKQKVERSKSAEKNVVQVTYINKSSSKNSSRCSYFSHDMSDIDGLKLIKVSAFEDMTWKRAAL